MHAGVASPRRRDRVIREQNTAAHCMVVMWRHFTDIGSLPYCELHEVVTQLCW